MHPILEKLAGLKAGERICALCGKVVDEKVMVAESLAETKQWGVCEACLPKGWEKDVAAPAARKAA